MKIVRFIASSVLASLFVAMVACSSNDSSSSGDPCTAAKQVSDSCSAKQSDSGAQISITFDVAQCQSGGDQAKKDAQCIVDNKSNCDCLVKCLVSGGTC